MRGVIVKTVGIIFHPLNEAASSLATELEKFLKIEGASVWECSAWDGTTAREKVEGTDLVVSIGGDGTILRAAQAIVPRNVPITGINLGKLGFMTELAVDEAKQKLPAMLAGEGWLDERSLLEVELDTGERLEPQRFYALNDVVVAHGDIARVIYVDAAIDDEPVTTYRADGVIVSTATGSTGYALAAGGPVLHPHAKEMVLLPIAPHLSASYNLVLPATSTVTLKVRTTHSATLTVDGHIAEPMPNNGTVTIRHSLHTIRFLRMQAETSFFSYLDKRLKGKQ